jgi:hypothetical protein
LGKVYLTIETDHENRWIFTDNFYGQLTAFQSQVFDNLADARRWLREQDGQSR